MLSSKILYNSLMNKVEALDLLKHLILQLRDDSPRLQSDPNLMKDWAVKSQIVQKELSALNSCDSDWVGTEYSKFFKQEISPYISKIDPQLLKSVK